MSQDPEQKAKAKISISSNVRPIMSIVIKIHQSSLANDIDLKSENNFLKSTKIIYFL